MWICFWNAIVLRYIVNADLCWRVWTHFECVLQLLPKSLTHRATNTCYYRRFVWFTFQFCFSFRRKDKPLTALKNMPQCCSFLACVVLLFFPFGFSWEDLLFFSFLYPFVCIHLRMYRLICEQCYLSYGVIIRCGRCCRFLGHSKIFQLHVCQTHPQQTPSLLIAKRASSSASPKILLLNPIKNDRIKSPLAPSELLKNICKLVFCTAHCVITFWLPKQVCRGAQHFLFMGPNVIARGCIGTTSCF